MFQANVFFADWWGVGEGKTIEEALANLQSNYPEKLRYTISYRPADRTIYYNASHIPCGNVMWITLGEQS